MFLPDLLRHLATLARNLTVLAQRTGNRVELDALREAEDFFKAHAQGFKDLH